MSYLKRITITVWAISVLFSANASIIRSVNESIIIQPSGEATLWRKVATADPNLKELYSDYRKFVLNNDSENDQRKRGLGLGIRLVFGSGKSIGIAPVEYKDLPELFESLNPIHIEAFAIRESHEDHFFYEIRHKRFEKEANPTLYERRYTEYVLDEMLFQSVFTDEYLSEDTDVRSFITRYETVYQLPDDAKIINRHALEAYTDPTELNVANFFRMNSRLIIEGDRIVIHVQEIEVFAHGDAEQLQSLNLKKLRQQFLKQDAFSIKYTLTESPDHLPPQKIPDHIKLDFEHTWNDLFERSKTLNLDAEGNAQISTTGILKSDFYLQWNWGWFELTDFTARFSVKPTVHSQIQYQQAASWEWKPEAQMLFNHSIQSNFMVGLLPVSIRFINEVELEAQSSLTIEGSTTLNLDLEWDSWGFHSIYQKGASTPWKHEWIKPSKPLQSTLSFDQNVTIETTLSATLPISLQARLYETAGPYISLNPTLSLDASVTLKPHPLPAFKWVAQGEISGGIRLSGWLQDLLHTPKDITLAEIDLGRFVIKEIP